jgi:uncharacterized membrane protein YdjX (TVP38/TMEM64 family)
MTKYWKKILLLLPLLLGVILFFAAADLVTFDAVKKHSAALQRSVHEHYLPSVCLLAAGFVLTAFFIPGALVLTVSGGFFFGAFPGAFFAAAFSTGGSLLAFLLSRHLIGGWVQQRYKKQLKRFNEEIARHGANYLFVLRVTPVLPSFVINYLSGLTRISAWRFALFSLLGIAPGAFIYSLAGLQLRSIETPKDLLSANVLIGIWLLALFALSPALFDLARWFIRTRSLRKKRTEGE